MINEVFESSKFSTQGLGRGSRSAICCTTKEMQRLWLRNNVTKRIEFIVKREIEIEGYFSSTSCSIVYWVTYTHIEMWWCGIIGDRTLVKGPPKEF